MQFIELRHPELIFIDIREGELEIYDFYKKQNTPIKEFVTLHSSTGYFKSGKDVTFLGINPVAKDLLAPNSVIVPEQRKSFWLSNSQIFAGMCAVVYDWLIITEKNNLPGFNDEFEPITWMEFLQAQVFTIKESNDWFGFFVDLTKMKDKFKPEIRDEINYLNEQGYNLIISSENRFLSQEVSANIFFQLTEKNRSLSIIDNYYSLTLEKTNFLSDYARNSSTVLELLSGKLTLFSIAKILDKKYMFSSSLSHFVKLFKMMSNQTLDSRSYDAILLDIFDRNRNPKSVELDTRLKNLINKTLKNGNITRDNKYNWALIIRSVIHNNQREIYAKVKNNPYEISELFSKKRSITKMERIYDAISNSKNNEAELKKYIRSQIDSLERIEQLLLR